MKDLVTCILNAGQSLEIVDSMRPFLQKHTKHGGAVPVMNNLRRKYVPEVFVAFKDSLKIKLSCKRMMGVMFDETTDAKDRAVLNILFGKYLRIKI